jgi:hypothetical protein
MDNTVVKAAKKFPSRICDAYSLLRSEILSQRVSAPGIINSKITISITGKVLKTTITFTDRYLD